MRNKKSICYISATTEKIRQSGDTKSMEEWQRKLMASGWGDNSQRGANAYNTLEDAINAQGRKSAYDAFLKAAAERKAATDEDISQMPLGDVLAMSKDLEGKQKAYADKWLDILAKRYNDEKQTALNNQKTAADIAKTQADTAKTQAEAENIPLKLKVEQWEAMTKGVDWFDASQNLPEGATLDPENPAIMNYKGGQFLLRITPDGTNKVWARDAGNDKRNEADLKYKEAQLKYNEALAAAKRGERDHTIEFLKTENQRRQSLVQQLNGLLGTTAEFYDFNTQASLQRFVKDKNVLAQVDKDTGEEIKRVINLLKDIDLNYNKIRVAAAFELPIDLSAITTDNKLSDPDDIASYIKGRKNAQQPLAVGGGK